MLGKRRAEDLLPAIIDGLLAWSRVLAVKETSRNYLGKVRLACGDLRATIACFEHPSIRRAKSTIMGLADAPAEKTACPQISCEPTYPVGKDGRRSCFGNVVSVGVCVPAARAVGTATRRAW